MDNTLAICSRTDITLKICRWFPQNLFSLTPLNPLIYNLFGLRMVSFFYLWRKGPMCSYKVLTIKNWVNFVTELMLSWVVGHYVKVFFRLSVCLFVHSWHRFITILLFALLCYKLYVYTNMAINVKWLVRDMKCLCHKKYEIWNM